MFQVNEFIMGLYILSHPNKSHATAQKINSMRRRTHSCAHSELNQADVKFEQIRKQRYITLLGVTA